MRIIMKHQPQHIICTVGTSLFSSNLEGLKKTLQEGKIPEGDRLLAEAYLARDWAKVAEQLVQRKATERTCGAEINSIQSLIDNKYVPVNVGLTFFHSATDDGRNIGAILAEFYRNRGNSPVNAVEVPDLQDTDPKRFRTHGLRNLARLICKTVREYDASTCAINATGGYKAQIAIAVLLGQSLGISVYYMHERFAEIIAFPPMPVAMDFEVWMRFSGMLSSLSNAKEPCQMAAFTDELEDIGDAEKFESLIERVDIDGVEHADLSATGQIFHETFRERFRTQRDQVLPPPASSGRKQKPNLKSNEAHMLAHRGEIERFLQKLTDEVPQVVLCTTSYFNPDLPERTRFRDARGAIEGIYSNGTWTMKFRVESTAETDGQRLAVIAALNDWLS
jgi:putative CRISPR-associated protein (TIGR02619 family)